ncbi:MAG TPA: polymer-forming cytoskeletal protein, partial [Candidatus Manganitrophaceae bacterium]
ATIQAEISAGVVILGGKVTGNIHARQKAHFLSKAVLNGSVSTPVLIVEEGVVFNGKCEMTRPERVEGVLPLEAVGKGRERA